MTDDTTEAQEMKPTDDIPVATEEEIRYEVARFKRSASEDESFNQRFEAPTADDRPYNAWIGS